ncbi:MAG: N,N-dimethylformamidase beta subunit family domain-containing protein, partial [Solirubrobacteraceae bacterium]
MIAPGLARVTMVVLLASVAAACGGGAQGFRASGTRGRRGVAPRPYRWLVRTTGAQPTVAEENAHPGTTAWRLPGPAADVGGLAYGSVTGYVAEQALRPGQTERIYVSAPGALSVRIRVYRMGWYGRTGGREVLASVRLPVVAQPPCAHWAETGLTECDWHPTLSFVIPPALPTGVYMAKLSTGEGARDCLFVVEAPRPQPLLAQLPTATYEAYNGWGGDSLYPGGADRVGVTGTTQGVAVSYDRPYDGVTGAGQFFARDVAMVRFLERYDYPVSYTTSESVDSNPSQLMGHRGLIDFGHSEYWSQRQENGFARARDAGTSLLFLGSDTLGWRVRYAAAGPASSEAGRPGHVIIAYKEHASRDPNRSDPTGPFPNRGVELADSAYLGCTTPRVKEPGPSTYRYYAWSPAPGLQPSWLFARTGIRAATRIPGIVGYELDERTPLTPAGTRLAGSGAAPCTSFTPKPHEPIPGAGDDLAETTIYTARSGAIVFDTGTLGWE